MDDAEQLLVMLTEADLDELLEGVRRTERQRAVRIVVEEGRRSPASFERIICAEIDGAGVERRARNVDTKCHHPRRRR